MTYEIRNWAVVAAAMEAQGATHSQMYRRAKAMSEGKLINADSYPAAPTASQLPEIVEKEGKSLPSFPRPRLL